MAESEETQFTHHIPEPCNEPIEILFADDDVLVVCKPAGLLSVPGRIVKDSVLQRVRFDYPDVRTVHRLDLDTSGLMVLALSQKASSDLSRQFRERQVHKHYIADVWEELELETGEIDLPIRPDPDNRPRQVVDHERGKPSLTHYERLRSGEHGSRVLLKPVTGRSHQLRLHLTAIGHPILGCDLYAHENALHASKRLCLHATELGFEHPATGEPLILKSPVPWE